MKQKKIKAKIANKTSSKKVSKKVPILEKNPKKKNNIEKTDLESEFIKNSFSSELSHEDDLEIKVVDSVNLEAEGDLNISDKVVKTYWTDETEDAVIDFLYLNELFYDSMIEKEIKDAKEEDRLVNKSYCNDMKKRKEDLLLILDREERREKIFKEKIETALKKLVENILFNYKLFIPDIDIKTQQRDCITFLYTKFTNFNPWENKKSFSYYGTVAKHYFQNNRKDYFKNIKITYDYDSKKEEADNIKIEEPKPYKKEDCSLDLFNYVIECLQSEINKKILSKNDLKTADAIIQIFKNHDIIGVYNKNQVYQLIKEITNLETKDITYSLHRFRTAYKFLKQDFLKIKEEED